MRTILVVGALLLAGTIPTSFVTASSGVRVYANELDDGRVVVETITPGSNISPTEKKTIQPQRYYHALYTPTDPDWKYQWNLEAINMPAAWEAGASVPFVGSSGIIVAVLDTGVAFETHIAPDLASTSIWTNSGEVAGDGIDNDGNGYIDDVHGWNFIADTNRPDDDFGHGTHIADIIAGGMNNDISISGIAPATTLMPVKVLDDEGIGTTDAITNGIRYATAAGADIINLSLGGTDHDPLLEDAIADARSAGVIVVAAAGNDGVTTLNYPARYTGVLSVGAVQYDGTKAPYSNSGTGLSIVAPGGNANLDQNGDILVDGVPAQKCTGIPCSTFATYLVAGTSQAAAHVSAVLALELACGATASAAQSAITSSATDIGAAGYDTMYGSGLINAQTALAAVGCVSSSPAAPANVVITAGGAAATSLSSTRAWTYTKPSFRWNGVEGISYAITWGKAGATPTTSTTTSARFQPSITSSGTYLFTVRAIDGNNHSSPIVTRQYVYRPALLLVGATNAVTAYTTQGKKVRSFSAFSKNAFGLGSSVTLGALDAIAVSDVQQSGVVKFYSSKGVLQSSKRIFSATSKSGISVTYLHQQNAAAVPVVASTVFGDVRWLDANGVTTIRKVSSTDTGYRIAAGDIDGDLHDELIVADRAGSTVRVYAADGTQLFSVRPRGASYKGGWSPAVGDINGDGKSEILLLPSADTKNPVISILNGTGKRIKTITLKGLRATTRFQLTAGNIDGGPRDRILLYGSGTTVNAYNFDGTLVRKITLPRTQVVSTLSIWQ